MKSFALGSMITLTTATTSFAQVPLQNPDLQLSQVSNFRCAPHLSTYVVKSLRGVRGKGVRCVKFSQGNSRNPRIPRLAWYGEGNWGGRTYRHVGHAFYRGRNLVGSASDIYGNGENFKNSFPGNLKLQIISGSRIRVTGAWNEEWIRVRSTNYRPLRRPRTCGKYFDQYRVSDLAGRRRGSGLRCVLRVGRKHTTWFGNGNWGGNTYSHIGTRGRNGYGAGDICPATFGPICNTFGYGSLKLTPVFGGFNVTGAWSEKWR
ncbi:MAG: hypothetical protein QNJ47_26610 [Nostocaceae cyanobacterium]|nr:hypothetical protein [Nostocaceae cyanobacterium]